MALDLGDLVAYLKTDNSRLDRGLAQGEVSMRASGRRMERQGDATASTIAAALTAGGVRGMEGLWRGADGRLRDASGRFAAAGAELGKAAGGAASGGIRTLWSGLGNLGTGITNVATNLWNLIPALLAVLAVIAALVPASYLLGGALGALPAIATGGLAAIATLGLGFMGLSDAFKKTSTGGGAVVDRLRQVALAERRAADANREVLATQLALTRARKDAAERIQDLTRNLAGARLDEGDAIQAVADARRDLDRAQEGGNPDQILRAQRAYTRTQQTLEDVRDRVQDLEEEQADAARKGVEGSDEVQAALERQRKAVEGVKDAQYELRKAQAPPSGGGGAAAEVTKLAASAATAVAVIKGLKPAFEDLRLDVQQRLFAGVGAEIQSLSDAWMPTLHTRLGSMADMFNGLFKSWAETSKDPEFIGNISTGWETIERLIGRVGEAIAGPGLAAFGRLAAAAAPFLDALGDGLAGIVEDFATWIKESEKSGKLDQFFEDAGKFLTYIIDIGKDAASIIGSIIAILMNPDGEDRDAGIKGFKEAMDGLAAWFNDPANREKIASFFKKLEEFFFWVKDTAIPAVKDFVAETQKWVDRFVGWAEKAKAFKDRVVGDITAVVNAVTGLPGRIGAAAHGMWDPIWHAFRAVANRIIGGWNGLRLTIGGGTFLGQEIPSMTFDTPDIPYLAQGGLVRATPGGRAVVAAEAGQDEIVSPVDMMRRIVSEELARVRQEQPTVWDPEIHVYVGNEEIKGMIQVEVRESNRGTKRRVTAGAGTR